MGLRFQVSGHGFRVSASSGHGVNLVWRFEFLGFWVLGFGFRVSGFWFRISGFGFRFSHNCRISFVLFRASDRCHQNNHDPVVKIEWAGP